MTISHNIYEPTQIVSVPQGHHSWCHRVTSIISMIKQFFLDFQAVIRATILDLFVHQVHGRVRRTSLIQNKRPIWYGPYHITAMLGIYISSPNSGDKLERKIPSRKSKWTYYMLKEYFVFYILKKIQFLLIHGFHSIASQHSIAAFLTSWLKSTLSSLRASISWASI